jgi:alpha-beta hydrolase superfamily lysophospholipase
MATTTAAKTARANAPGPMEPTETVHFTSKDGTGLYGEYFGATEDARARILIVHGYQEHCGRYREVANVLHGAGFASMSFDMRGHGRSKGQRGHVSSFEDYLEDIEAALDQLNERAGADLPLLIVAHSNGSLATLRMLADPWRVPKGLVAAVLSSPFLGLALKVNPVKSFVGKIASRALPTLTLKSELKIEDLTHDPEKKNERELDTLCHDVATARWFSQALQTHEWVHEFAPRVELPTLWLVAGGDRIADPAATRAVHERITAPTRYEEYADMHHEVFNELERGRVFDTLLTFLDEQIQE